MYAIFEGSTFVGYTEAPNYVVPHPQGAELGLVPCEFSEDCGVVFNGKLYSISGCSVIPGADGEASIVTVDTGRLLTELSKGLEDTQLALTEIYERLEG